MQLDELLGYSSIVIQCHDFPDADTLASGYGVYCYLTQNGKNPSLVYSGKQPITKPNLVHMIDLLGIPIKYVSSISSPEALVTVDCCYGEGNVTKYPAENVFVIDHHRVKADGAKSSEIRSAYSSCSTVVAQLLKKAQFSYNDDKKLATALYYGLYTDTNGLNEINHPADKDLRDLTDFDEIIINLLKNSNFSSDEIKVAGDALKHCTYDKRYNFAIAEAMPCDPNILGFICDMLLQVDGVDTCVVFCRRPFGIKLSVRSCVNDIRADELVKYIAGEYGTGGGSSRKAGGYIRELPESIDIRQFICAEMVTYHENYEVIRAEEFRADISSMKKYFKQPIKLGFVNSAELLGAGLKICVRTLEGDIDLCTDENVYIMVGVRGEVYPIRREKFELSYRVCDEPFVLKSDYHPSVVDRDTFASVDLLPYIKSCVPAGRVPIYARQLERTVKVYTAWDTNNYMLGNIGDYLAVRCDDLHDIYVIEREIFSETYREAK